MGVLKKITLLAGPEHTPALPIGLVIVAADQWKPVSVYVRRVETQAEC
jgi:hypothetical protein